ncbi:MAG: hypothetical protein IT303_12165 [Dehalococcoidia bacterium]|nr:hypothetical protein [Dehalococcoidia bacterium]
MQEPPPETPDPPDNRVGDAARYAVTLPERVIRATAAAVGGGVHETGQLLLPRFVRRSRFYEVTAKNALRIAVELVGGVEGGSTRSADPEAPAAGRLAVKKAAGNAVEIGSIAAFGFSPLWLLAAASDVLNGSRVYLSTLEDELAAAGYLAQGVHFGSVDQLLGALQGATGTTAGAIDTPPVEIAELRASISELKGDVASLPTPAELAGLFNGLVRLAVAEQRSLLIVSSGIGLAFVTSARTVSSRHVIAPYREDWQPLREEGFGAYATRVAGPYRTAITGHFHRDRRTWTERVLAWLRARFLRKHR